MGVLLKDGGQHSMGEKKLVIKHNLETLSPEELTQYLRDVSEFINLDPDLNGLDTIWMPNETGPGKSLVVYARRGTAEILRNIYGIVVETLVHQVVSGSIVFTTTGHNKVPINGMSRQEIAVGSKYIQGLTGKALDDAIMTASTRALRRLTMQFTTLGILDESEVVATVGQQVNPASDAQLAGSPVVLPTMPTVPANNAPGKVVEQPTPTPAAAPAVAPPNALGEPFTGQQSQINEVWKQQADKNADKKGVETPISPSESVPSDGPEADKKDEEPKKKRARRKNTVSLEVEPEVVSAPPAAAASAPVINAASVEMMAAQISVAPEPPAVKAVEQAVPDANMPNETQMAEYRKRIGVFTAQLPASDNMGSVQKMRAFITKMSGTAPQFMTVKQWMETIAWFDDFVGRNQTKGLVNYINDTLGVK